jgi:hypothetical protein
MLANYVEWHMRQLLEPILFDDHDKAAADVARISIVAKAKAKTKRDYYGLPVHGFRSRSAMLRPSPTMGERRGAKQCMALPSAPSSLTNAAF